MLPIVILGSVSLMDELIERYRELSLAIALEFAKQDDDHSMLFQLDAELTATLDTLVNLQPANTEERKKLAAFLLSLLTEGRDGGKVQRRITQKIVNLIQ